VVTNPSFTINKYLLAIVSNKFLSLPSVSEASNQDLRLESTLRELPLYQFEAQTSCLGAEVAEIFEQYPLLPGAILIDQGKFVGMISRRRLLEYLLRPQGLELFLNQPLHVLYSYARTEMLLVNDSTPILVAVQQALRRSPELLSEPLVVKVEPNSYRLLDFQELNITSWQIRGIETQVRYERAQTQMIQTEKMASLGRLVDGVAHEILDPVGFIWGNLTHVSSYSQQLLELVAAYQANIPELPAVVAELETDIEIDYLQEDLPRAIASIQSGAERLKKLALALQNFCHIDEVYPKPADLHSSINHIILLLKSRLSSDIDVIKNYGHLPPVSCFIGQIHQVFMNILTNAIDALINHALSQKFAQELHRKSHVDTGYKPQITITTEVIAQKSPYPGIPDQRLVSIKIADNGPGMSPELQQQILESFSIAKRADKETSLSVSYQIIKAKHGGDFMMRSQLGVGTEFEILLPLV
jgi:signal transduction histidine kinase